MVQSLELGALVRISRFLLIGALAFGCSEARAQVARVEVAGLACDNGTLLATSFGESASSVVSASSVSLTKALDACSPALFQAVSEGQHFSTVTLLTADASQTEVQIQLQNVVLTGDQLTLPPNGGAPVEHLTMAYASATVGYLVGGAIQAPQSRGIARAADQSSVAGVALTIGACTSPAQSWNFSVTAGTKPTFQLSVLKSFDSCSPGFFAALQKRQQIDMAGLTVTASGALVPFLAVTLNGVTITSDVVTEQAGGALEESLTLAFVEITVENNTANNGVSWDVMTNKPAN